jgi:hypothetical protein
MRGNSGVQSVSEDVEQRGICANIRMQMRLRTGAVLCVCTAACRMQLPVATQCTEHAYVHSAAAKHGPSTYAMSAHA